MDTSGRYPILKVEIEDKSYILTNIYAPNKDKDLVDPLNPLLDKKGGVMTPKRAVIENIFCMQSELDLIDIWRTKNPETKSYTWSQNLPMVFCRLDYWLISNSLQDFVKSTNIIPAIKTDHAAIDLVLSDIGNEAKGPGFWKFNCSLLNDDNYINELNCNVPKWRVEGGNELSDKRAVWDWIKYNIRAHAISYSKSKAKQRQVEEMHLQDDYDKQQGCLKVIQVTSIKFA